MKLSFDIMVSLLWTPHLCRRDMGTNIALRVSALGTIPCRACNGHGRVLVYQPSIICPRCKGTGEVDGSGPASYLSQSCTVCLGTGWARMLPLSPLSHS